VFVNKFTCKQADALLLLQLFCGPLRDVASEIVLRNIALDPSASNSPLITRVFYSLLPETAAERTCSDQFPNILRALARAETSFLAMVHAFESDEDDVGVDVAEGHSGWVDDGAAATQANRFVRIWRAMIRPFNYFHLLRFLIAPSSAPPSSTLRVACDLHRQWSNLLSIDLEHLMFQNLAALQLSLANTAAAAKMCCEDGAAGACSLSSLFMETVKFFRVGMWLQCTEPVIAQISRREVVSSLLYSSVFLASLYSFLFLYLKATLLPIFNEISSAIFYLGVSGSVLIMLSKVFRIRIHQKVTTPLLSGHPVFSLLHDALLLRHSHRAIHPLLLSTEAHHESDGNIVAALALQTPLCSASTFLCKPLAHVPAKDEYTFQRLGSSLAAAARQALRHGMFPAICVGSAGHLTNSGTSLSKVMQNHLFVKLMKEGSLERDRVAVDWWCGLNISGKRFSILHQLGLAPTVTVLYVSDRLVPAAEGGISLQPHLPLHDSGPIGM
jgi:hypothetical protein